MRVTRAELGSSPKQDLVDVNVNPAYIGGDSSRITHKMPALRSALNPQSDAFRSNAARMQERLDQVRALESQVREGSASKREKFDKRGQLLPRERVARLISDFTANAA